MQQQTMQQQAFTRTASGKKRTAVPKKPNDTRIRKAKQKSKSPLRVDGPVELELPTRPEPVEAHFLDNSICGSDRADPDRRRSRGSGQRENAPPVKRHSPSIQPLVHDIPSRLGSRLSFGERPPILAPPRGASPFPAEVFGDGAVREKSHTTSLELSNSEIVSSKLMVSVSPDRQLRLLGLSHPDRLSSSSATHMRLGFERMDNAEEYVRSPKGLPKVDSGYNIPMAPNTVGSSSTKRSPVARGGWQSQSRSDGDDATSSTPVQTRGRTRERMDCANESFQSHATRHNNESFHSHASAATTSSETVIPPPPPPDYSEPPDVTPPPTYGETKKPRSSVGKSKPKRASTSAAAFERTDPAAGAAGKRNVRAATASPQGAVPRLRMSVLRAKYPRVSLPPDPVKPDRKPAVPKQPLLAKKQTTGAMKPESKGKVHMASYSAPPVTRQYTGGGNRVVSVKSVGRATGVNSKSPMKLVRRPLNAPPTPDDFVLKRKSRTPDAPMRALRQKPRPRVKDVPGPRAASSHSHEQPNFSFQEPPNLSFLSRASTEHSTAAVRDGDAAAAKRVVSAEPREPVRRTAELDELHLTSAERSGAEDAGLPIQPQLSKLTLATTASSSMDLERALEWGSELAAARVKARKSTPSPHAKKKKPAAKRSFTAPAHQDAPKRRSVWASPSPEAGKRAPLKAALPEAARGRPSRSPQGPARDSKRTAAERSERIQQRELTPKAGFAPEPPLTTVLAMSSSGTIDVGERLAAGEWGAGGSSSSLSPVLQNTKGDGQRSETSFASPSVPNMSWVGLSESMQTTPGSNAAPPPQFAFGESHALPASPPLANRRADSPKGILRVKKNDAGELVTRRSSAATSTAASSPRMEGEFSFVPKRKSWEGKDINEGFFMPKRRTPEEAMFAVLNARKAFIQPGDDVPSPVSESSQSSPVQSSPHSPMAHEAASPHSSDEPPKAGTPRSAHTPPRRLSTPHTKGLTAHAKAAEWFAQGADLALDAGAKKEGVVKEEREAEGERKDAGTGKPQPPAPAAAARQSAAPRVSTRPGRPAVGPRERDRYTSLNRRSVTAAPPASEPRTHKPKAATKPAVTTAKVSVPPVRRSKTAPPASEPADDVTATPAQAAAEGAAAVKAPPMGTAEGSVEAPEGPPREPSSSGEVQAMSERSAGAAVLDKLPSCETLPEARYVDSASDMHQITSSAPAWAEKLKNLPKGVAEAVLPRSSQEDAACTKSRQESVRTASTAQPVLRTVSHMSRASTASRPTPAPEQLRPSEMLWGRWQPGSSRPLDRRVQPRRPQGSSPSPAAVSQAVEEAVAAAASRSRGTDGAAAKSPAPTPSPASAEKGRPTVAAPQEPVQPPKTAPEPKQAAPRAAGRDRHDSVKLREAFNRSMSSISSLSASRGSLAAGGKDHLHPGALGVFVPVNVAQLRTGTPAADKGTPRHRQTSPITGQAVGTRSPAASPDRPGKKAARSPVAVKRWANLDDARRQRRAQRDALCTPSGLQKLERLERSKTWQTPQKAGGAEPSDLQRVLKDPRRSKASSPSR
eukprot:TRINITY_DN16323_c0_g1_i1.p1 TRINITY_DN16323_c0_g1~~TRINITY_DN16323_c0_g1_i1.p1  ORF type:complete len:1541 (+),score=423.17 TRINITY_DN16323_c0_g1_i1:130-4752(+)